jgi:polyhydroxybutyrate depolymerase
MSREGCMSTSRNVRLSSWAVVLLGGCLSPAAPTAPVAASKVFRLALCTEPPVRLPAPAAETQTRGCVATFTQTWSDPDSLRWPGTNQAIRRYLVYAPARLPAVPVPLVFVFPGSSASAESAALYYTHSRFESLADRDGFIVVYGNGLPTPFWPGDKPSVPKGGFLPGCWAPHTGEGLDVTYVRAIIEQLAKELTIDRSRIYATGLSMGGGMSLQLALEAPDLIAAIAPVAPVPFQPAGEWLHSCHPRPGFEKVSIAMLAATADPFVSYAPGPSTKVPQAHFPGMEPTRDAWLSAMKIAGTPTTDSFADLVTGDSYLPFTGLPSSTVECQRYPAGPDGQEFWYYKATGMGHWWPSPKPMWPGLWATFGKANQDIDFADQAWDFFQRHHKN